MILPRLFNLIASAAAGFDAATHADVEVLLPEELLQGEVHPVGTLIRSSCGTSRRSSPSSASQSCNGRITSMEGEARCRSTILPATQGSQ